MRIGWLTACDYEWTQHWRVACGLGVPSEDLLAVRDWCAHSTFGGPERAVLAATDEVVRDGAVGAQTWAACERELGADSAVLVELVTAIAAWRMIASILHSLEVPLEDRCLQLAARRSAADSVGLHRTGDVAVGQ